MAEDTCGMDIEWRPVASAAIPDDLLGYVERILVLYDQLDSNWGRQRAELERAGQIRWPKGHTGRDGRRLQSPMSRFVRYLDMDHETGCWNWIGSLNENGYGGFPLDGRRWLAHRWIYLLLKGPIADGLVIDHVCHNKRCVNIAHLEAVTQSVNVKRSLGRPIDLPIFIPRRGVPS